MRSAAGKVSEMGKILWEICQVVIGARLRFLDIFKVHLNWDQKIYMAMEILEFLNNLEFGQGIFIF